jgi:hypothetical protein
MLRKLSLFPALLALLTVTIILVAQNAVAQKTSLPIRIGQVTLNSTHVDPNQGGSVVFAFVPTGSLSPNCLATLGDSNFAQSGTTVHCVPRQPAGLGLGVALVIFYPSVTPPDLFVNVTLLHEGARKYGQPVLCNLEGC